MQQKNMIDFFLEQIDKVNQTGYTNIEIQDPDFFKDLIDFTCFEQLGFKIDILSDKIIIDWSDWGNG